MLTVSCQWGLLHKAVLLFAFLLNLDYLKVQPLVSRLQINYICDTN